MDSGILPSVLPSALPGPILLSSAAESPEGCQVLGNTFGFIVQGLLFGLCVGSLLMKWRMEVPRRTFNVFVLDSSKQLVGAGTIHCLNLLCAVIFSDLDKASADECAWYWINIMIDTTFGVLVCFAFLRVSEKVFNYNSGHYGKKAQTGIDWETKPDYSKWAAQITFWCLIVCMMKIVVVIIMWSFAPFWETSAIMATHWIIDRQQRLIFVMLFTPLCMNLFQFWVQDSFLKYSKKQKDAVENELEPPKDV